MKQVFIFSVIIIALSACGGSKEKSGYRDLSSDKSSASAGSSSPHSEKEGIQNQMASGQITAAEWNDLNHWDFWESLGKRQEFSSMPAYWQYNLQDRIAIHLRHTTSGSLADVPVELVTEDGDVLWRSRTDNDGDAELWPSLKKENQYAIADLKIRINGELFKNPVAYSTKEVNRIAVQNLESPQNNQVDIAFMVDATGSMGDELEYLKTELTDVIADVKAKNDNITVNTGAVFYRDKGDDYVTKLSAFTSNTGETVDFIKEQSADGGGDFPEAVHEALRDAISGLQWSSHARARILFVVLDAPPHHDGQIPSEINRLIEKASAEGIAIIPVTASGIDKETEFLMRYMAIATNGTYVFITNDSGIGNTHLEASVGDYQVEYLNSLMKRLINERLK